jgi:hypothetical protein
MKVVKVWDPNFDFRNNDTFACIMGGLETTPKIYPFDSGSSNQQATLNQNIPDMTAVSKKWNIRETVTINFTGNSNDINRNLLQSGYDSFSEKALYAIMDNVQLVLNGQSNNVDISEVYFPLSLYRNNCRNLGEREQSMQPATKDQSQSFAQLEGSIRNPLNSIFDSNGRDAMGRGGFVLDSFVNTPTSATITATLTCELPVSPLHFGNNRETESFINLTTFSINIRWKTNLTRIWSHSTASLSTISNIDVILGVPDLLVEQKTYPLSLQLDLPIVKLNSFYEILKNPRDIGAVLPGATHVALSQTIQPSSVPRFLLIYLQKTDGLKTYTDTNSYAKINNIQIQWNNKNSLYNQADIRYLYKTCAKNGLDLNYSDFSADDSYLYVGDQTAIVNGPGSVILLEYGTDIALDGYSGEAPGVGGKNILFVTVSFTNKHPTDTINYTLYVLNVIPGVFGLKKEQGFKNTSAITRMDVMQASFDHKLNYEDLNKRLMSGGVGFFKKLGRFLRKHGKQIYKIAAPIAKQVARTVAPELNPFINLIPDKLGNGRYPPQYQNMYTGQNSYQYDDDSGDYYDYYDSKGSSIVGGAANAGLDKYWKRYRKLRRKYPNKSKKQINRILKDGKKGKIKIDKRHKRKGKKCIAQKKVKPKSKRYKGKKIIRCAKFGEGYSGGEYIPEEKLMTNYNEIMRHSYM